MASLTGRVAIVTGAARGIGQEYCRAFAREGARVIAADILSCEETVTKVQESGGGSGGGDHGCHERPEHRSHDRRGARAFWPDRYPGQ